MDCPEHRIPQFAGVSIHDYGSRTEKALRSIPRILQAKRVSPGERAGLAKNYSLLLRSSRSDDPSTRSTWTSMTTRRGLARGVR